MLGMEGLIGRYWFGDCVWDRSALSSPPSFHWCSAGSCITHGGMGKIAAGVWLGSQTNGGLLVRQNREATHKKSEPSAKCMQGSICYMEDWWERRIQPWPVAKLMGPKAMKALGKFCCCWCWSTQAAHQKWNYARIFTPFTPSMIINFGFMNFVVRSFGDNVAQSREKNFYANRFVWGRPKGKEEAVLIQSGILADLGQKLHNKQHWEGYWPASESAWFCGSDALSWLCIFKKVCFSAV